MSRNIYQDSNQSAQSGSGIRPYGCPCGKTYLSYPALFTHVKQKHSGEAPGELIKPKTGKLRGRPKTRVENKEEDQLIELQKEIESSLSQLVKNMSIRYTGNFIRSNGNSTCQDAASIFLRQFSESDQSANPMLVCFLSLLKSAIDEAFGQSFWEEEKPGEIISIANKIYFQQAKKQQQFPLPQELLKQLLFIFFQWMYANNWTDHRLIYSKRPQPLKNE